MRDVGQAEELAQDALVAALAEWPRTGVPARPGAWLTTVAHRRAVDAIRRNRMRTRKREEAERELHGAIVDGTQTIEAAMDDGLGDELLRLLFAACHHMLSREARVVLTLQVVFAVHICDGDARRLSQLYQATPRVFAALAFRCQSALNLTDRCVRQIARAMRLAHALSSA